MERNAVVLLSGGIDSAVALAVAKSERYAPFALSFRYGQRHAVELEAARRVAAAAGVREHAVVDFDLRPFGGSSLTGAGPVPKDRSAEERGKGVPTTYVPGRNTIFLSFAMAFAEVKGADDVFVGVNAMDEAGYPDCRPEYLAAFENTARLATRAGTADGRRFQIHAPLVAMDKAAIIRRGLELGVPFEVTHSCYDPTPAGEACGGCDACLLRLEGFRRNGVADPVRYANS